MSKDSFPRVDLSELTFKEYVEQVGSIVNAEYDRSSQVLYELEDLGYGLHFTARDDAVVTSDSNGWISIHHILPVLYKAGYYVFGVSVFDGQAAVFAARERPQKVSSKADDFVSSKFSSHLQRKQGPTP